MKEYKRRTVKGRVFSNKVNESFRELYSILQELEDKIENKTLIELPCKFGDLLFCIDSCKSIGGEKVQYSIKMCRVTEICAFSGGGFVIGVREINNHFGHNVVIGERAFFTVEEAEAKLAELRKAQDDGE